MNQEKFKCWVCNDKEINGRKEFIAHINEVHRKPNGKPNFSEKEANRIADMFLVDPNTRRVTLFGETFDLIIKGM